MDGAMDYDDFDFDQPVEDGETAESQHRKRKKRVRNWTAEDRAKHRVFEKSRREAFNERLNELASLLPTLQNAKDTQLSKHVIVDESVKHHHSQNATIDELGQSLRGLKAQNEQLLAEVNAWRQAANVPTPRPNGASGADATISSVIQSPTLHASGPNYEASRKAPMSVPSGPGTYSDGLVQLAADPVAPTLPAYDGSLPHGDLPEASHPLNGSAGPFIPNPDSAFQDQRLQRLFERFQSPVATSNGEQMSQPQLAMADEAPFSEFRSDTIPLGMQDLWRMQWMGSVAQPWDHTNATAEFGETDINAMPFRNNATMANV